MGGGGSSSTQGSYDPQVGQAALENAQTSQQSLSFAQSYFNQYVAPALAASTAQTNQSTAEQNQLYSLELPQAQTTAAQYQQYGAPAQVAYYQQAQQFSSPNYQAQQGDLAAGDVGAATASANQQLNETLASRGINPSSPGAIAAAQDASITTAANKAAANTMARNSAQQMGLQVTADAANYANSGVANAATTAGVASNAASNASSIASGGVGTANSGASVEQTGYGQALTGYGNNLSAYSSLDSSSLGANAQMSAASSGGLGSLVGGVFQGLGSFAGSANAATLFSDRRLKTDIEPVGKTKGGLNIYTYRYKADPTHAVHMGVMAQEALKKNPKAVGLHGSGYLMVDYGKIK
jgi:hypothetical protein